MGLLDGILSGGSSGGLLDFLRYNAMNQQPFGMPASDQAQYGPPPAQLPPAVFSQQPQPQAPPQVQPQVQPQAQPQQVPSQSPELGANPGGIGAGISGFLNNLPNGPVGAIIGGIGSAAGLQDASSLAAARKANMTAAYLRKSGIPEEGVRAAVGDWRTPGDPEVLKTVLSGLKEKTQVHPATAAEKAAAGIPADVPLFIDENGKPTFAPPSTNVNVSTEKTGQAELATKGVQAYVDAQNVGRDAQKRIALYDTFQKAAEGFTPGATAEMRLTAKRYLKDAGIIKGEDVPDGEVMQMISRQLGIHAQPKGQGAVSNYERELFAKSLPNMTQSPEGLKQAIEISRNLEKFDQQVAQIYRDSAKANKGLPNYLEVQEKIAALGSPLSDNQMAAISGGSTPPTSGSPAVPAPAAPAASSTGWTNIGNGVKIRPK